jgi:hypothetical protein
MSDRMRTAEELVNTVAIPESAYETAKNRYEDLAAWMRRPESRIVRFSPHVYPQGSFRLGTVVRPITETGDYDLDLGCRLQIGITKRTHTQKQLKQLVGAELAAYRTARQIKDPLEELHRCWRLGYRDNLAFHMDAVPSIPEEYYRRAMIRESIIGAGVGAELAATIAERTGAITDDRLPNYDELSDAWYISNSEGYALWFESRMKVAAGLMQERAIQAKVGRVDELPAYKWRSPLQACVQILKRHRDVMYDGDSDRQPISIIITTLSAHAYDGSTDIPGALENILRRMDSYIRASAPRVPNPVNPAEDFADKWANPKYRHLDLEGNFYRWLGRARRDLDALLAQQDPKWVSEYAQRSFAAPLDPARLGPRSSGLLVPAASASLSFPPQAVVPSKPAGFA